MSDRVEKFVYDGEKADRLDKFLVTCLPEFSRARLQGLIDEGFVTINNVRAKKSGQSIDPGAEIEVRIPPPVPSGLVGEDIPLDIIFENDDLLIVNKPAGMVVHPAAGHDSGTLVHAVLGYDPDLEGIGGEERPGLVHRLDKETSGLIVLAKNERAHRWLQDQFRLRTVEKTYLALVDGMPPTPTGRVEASIGRDPSHRKKMAIVTAGKGREAVSEYKTLEAFKNHTLLEFHPHTGRTHQIRLHCQFLGCPIVGDSIYGRKNPTVDLDRHFLHAYRLKIVLPGEKEPRVFTAALPEELEGVLTDLRG
ncbi:MAG TPA: RluA family pseudouridine synthase [Anaerolineales bacterium]|nr:RluA family pseudouridine synthase [Anaerolineales bacterium]HMV95121.1 RluA family pseudouridine synthase [Anaerolineales bacterium]HMX18308.1 RluA family pseudouridine synthase [Anaerolineales bacterium]HMX72795.1 RluA family pseudouridine synthase [Anaerolineales bacterium]HMZ41814.1 RluA family pseudouridine synthase [Anaerolineales bacterium]